MLSKKSSEYHGTDGTVSTSHTSRNSLSSEPQSNYSPSFGTGPSPNKSSSSDDKNSARVASQRLINNGDVTPSFHVSSRLDSPSTSKLPSASGNSAASTSQTSSAILVDSGFVLLPPEPTSSMAEDPDLPLRPLVEPPSPVHSPQGRKPANPKPAAISPSSTGPAKDTPITSPNMHTKNKKQVTFPPDESIVTGYMDPPDPWRLRMFGRIFPPFPDQSCSFFIVHLYFFQAPIPFKF